MDYHRLMKTWITFGLVFIFAQIVSTKHCTISPLIKLRELVQPLGGVVVPVLNHWTIKMAHSQPSKIKCPSLFVLGTAGFLLSCPPSRERTIRTFVSHTVPETVGLMEQLVLS
ncbi:hypothetical protein M8J77_012431 [Diaphorina citri]|nr:hypothetical protein M8J77_012431 [Diaphorina citri]